MPDIPGRGRREDNEIEPKPFGKVRLRRGKSIRSVTPHNQFRRGTYTGDLDCTLIAKRPLRVGSGIYELIESGPFHGIVLADGNVVLPGTSLKGAIRATAEAISDSCVRITDPGKRLDERLSQPGASACREVKSKHRDSKAARAGAATLCVCCSIFGGLGYQGRMSFSDATLVAGGTLFHQIPAPYSPQERAGGYKDNHGGYDGRKFYYHGEPISADRGEPYLVIREESELDFVMRFENLTAEEFCLVLTALGMFDDIVIKIGGGKQAMLGSAEIWPNRLELRTPESFENFAGGSTVIEENVLDYLRDLVEEKRELVNEEALDELLDIWEWPSSRKAPLGVY